MKKKRLVTGIVALIIAASLAIIVTMQCFYLITSYQKSIANIEESINDAINQTVLILRNKDAINYYRKKRDIDTNSYNIKSSSFDQLHKSGYDPFSRVRNSELINSIYLNPEFSIYEEEYTRTQLESLLKKVLDERQLTYEQIIMQIESEAKQDTTPLEERYDIKNIRNILQKSLSRNNLINFEFEFAITDFENNIKLQSENFNMNSKSKYEHNMAPENIFSKPNVLHVEFFNIKKIAFESIYTQLITSVLLTLLFIFTLGVSLYALMRQKRLATIKNDFINNMTHEFKTPIATIKLATASLKNPKTLQNKDVMNNMLDIIAQETSRMNHHIEQVLQMAILDKKNLDVKKRKENINDIIQDIVSNSELVVAEKGGSVNLIIIDENVYLNIDRDLITNAINNLIDNAIKYSKDAPEIKVTTFIERDKFHIAVKDNGIGMSKDAQSKIFDKFYRAPTGNVHNIKGFGLGLNYVREIVCAHKGTISVRSCLGKGSTFTIILPLK